MRLLFTGNRVVLFVQHDQYNICRTQIKSYLELIAHRLERLGFRSFYALHIRVYTFEIHHKSCILY